MKKTLLALAVSLAAVSGANAAWINGTAGSHLDGDVLGNGEALLFLVDEVNQKSYTQDLNILFSTLSNPTYNTTVALNAAGLSVFGGNYTNVKWGIVAYGGNDTTTAADGPHSSTAGSIFSTSSALPFQSDLFALQYQAAATVIGNAGALFGPSLNSSQYVTYAAGVGAYAGDDSFLAQLNAIGPVTGSTGQTLNLAYFGWADNAFTVDRQGNFTTASLNLAGNSLAIGSAPAVPVPAAVWLLGSALAGLGSIARKRKA